MQALLLSVFSRSSLSLGGFVLSVLCAWPQPTDAPAFHGARISPISATPVFDCNQNGIEDSVDIALGASSDQNHNGVPDECEAAN